MAQKRTVFLSWGVALTVVVAGVLGFTGWYVYNSSQAADKAMESANKVAAGDVPKVTVIDSFEDCTKASGSKLLETYPEQCPVRGSATLR